MRNWVKFLLFASSYTPLFLILILQYLEIDDWKFLVGLISLAVINVVWILLLFFVEKWGRRDFTVKKAVNKTSDTLNYVITYVVALVSLDFTKWQDWVSLLILLSVIYAIFIHSNLLFVNPMLNLFGYKFYEVEVKEGGTVTIISKKRLKADMKISIKKISDDIFILRD
jgi:hypothetical protein